MVIQTHIWFSIWIGSNGMLSCFGFLSRNPLRNILVSKAVSSSVIENLSSEFFDNTVLLHQFSSMIDYSHPSIQSMFYLAGFLWYKLYGSNRRIGNMNGGSGMGEDDSKLVAFDTYVISRQVTRQILFVLLFLLTKNVENVY